MFFFLLLPFLDLIVWEEIPQLQKNSVLLSTHQTFHTVVLLHVTYFEASKHNNCSISLVFLQESCSLSFTVAQIPSTVASDLTWPIFLYQIFLLHGLIYRFQIKISLDISILPLPVLWKFEFLICNQNKEILE